MNAEALAAALTARLEEHQGLYEEFHEEVDRGYVNAYREALNLLRLEEFL